MLCYVINLINIMDTFSEDIEYDTNVWNYFIGTRFERISDYIKVHSHIHITYYKQDEIAIYNEICSEEKYIFTKYNINEKNRIKSINDRKQNITNENKRLSDDYRNLEKKFQASIMNNEDIQNSFIIKNQQTKINDQINKNNSKLYADDFLIDEYNYFIKTYDFIRKKYIKNECSKIDLDIYKKSNKKCIIM